MAKTKDIASRLAGRFIVIDGPDGAGKGTQIEMLVSAYLEGSSWGFRTLNVGSGATCYSRHPSPDLRETWADLLTVHDPGGTETGDQIRQILLHSEKPFDVKTETLLFMASRAQLVVELIRPALIANNIVLCDRFISATCAYQGAAGADLARIIDLGRFAVGETWPDLTIVLDLPAEEGLHRIGVLGRDKLDRPKRNRRLRKDDRNSDSLFKDARLDTMEARPLAFHRKVREIFRSLPGIYPRPVKLVEASADPQVVHQRILEILARVDF